MLPIMRQVLMPTGIVKRGLVAWYDFTEPAGSQVLTDKSGYGNHGQNGSTTGADTNDVTFDGVKATFGGDDYVALPLLLNGLTEWTISIVPYYNSVTAAQSLFCERSSSDNQPINAYFSTVATTGALKLEIRNDTGTATATVTTPLGYSSEYAVYTGVRAKQAAHIYRNGELLSTSSFATLGLITCDLTSIGVLRYNAVTTNYLKGNVYCFMVYNRALSALELNHNYRSIKKLLAKRGVTLG